MNTSTFFYNRLKKRQRDNSHHLSDIQSSPQPAVRVLTHFVRANNSVQPFSAQRDKKMVRFYEQNSFQKRAGRYLRRWLWCIGIVELCICTPAVAAVLSTQSSVDKNHFACITPERDVMFFLKASGPINGKECKTHFRKISKGLSARNEGYVSIHYRTGIGAVIFNSFSKVFDNQAHQAQKSWFIIRDETNYCWQALYEPDYNYFNGLGGYTQVLELEDSAFASECANINTPRPNTAPSADAGKSYSIIEGTNLVLEASGSSDADGDSLSYAWDLDNDGAYDDASGVNPTVTWETLNDLGYVTGVGSFSVGLEVNDGKGGTDTATASLTIASSVTNADDDKLGTTEHGKSSMTELAHFTKGLESFLKGMEHYNNKDYVEAVKWIRQAAEHDLAQAQNHLGVMYQYGNGVTKNYQQAVKWYRKAAEQENAEAQFKLGMMYFEGKGVTQDNQEAVKWYRKAAEHENAEAQYQLGFIYDYGEGVREDDREAVEWYRKAAEQGNAEAQLHLGVMYSLGYGVNQNDQDAVKWLRKAAEQESAKAQTFLGLMYFKGEGVTENKPEAVQWFRKAANNDDTEAQNNLGVIYQNGYGVNKDEKEAVKWFRKAAEQGYAMAQYNLGDMYEFGKGVTKDYQQAIKWYRKAAKQGNADAQKKLDALKN